MGKDLAVLLIYSLRGSVGEQPQLIHHNAE